MTDRIIAFLILCLMFSLPFGVAVIFTGEVMLNFVFFWPLFMSFTVNVTGNGEMTRHHRPCRGIHWFPF